MVERAEHSRLGLGAPGIPLPGQPGASGPRAHPTVPTCDLCSPSLRSGPPPTHRSTHFRVIPACWRWYPARPGQVTTSIRYKVLPNSVLPEDPSRSSASCPGSPRWPRSSCLTHTLANKRERCALPPGKCWTLCQKGPQQGYTWASGQGVGVHLPHHSMMPASDPKHLAPGPRGPARVFTGWWLLRASGLLDVRHGRGHTMPLSSSQSKR